MDYEALGRQMVAYMRAFLAASEALDRAEDQRVRELAAEGMRIVDVHQDESGDAVVTDHETQELLAHVPQDAYLGRVEGFTWPDDWYSHDGITSGNSDPDGTISSAQEHLFELDDNKPFSWLSKWEPLDQVPQIREFLSSIDAV